MPLLLSQVRAHLAALLGMPVETLRQTQRQLGIVEELRPLGIGPYDRGGRPSFAFATPATPANVALLLVAGMSGAPRSRVADATTRLWHARPDAPGGECAVTRTDTLARALCAVLRTPELAARLDAFEVCHQYATALMCWSRARPTIWHSLALDEGERRLRHMDSNTATTVSSVPGAAIVHLARLLDEGVTTPRVHADRVRP